MFLCREQELSTLNKRYQKSTFECIIIYGRRRVGKTSIINEFCKAKPTIFFSALNASAQENLEALSQAIHSYSNPSAVNAPIYPNLDSALNAITELAKKERLIFVIDEYPYLAKADASISSRLQHLIDHVWEKGNLFLILCGSSMSFMENQVLGYESPLYGRRTGQMKIQALTYKEMTAFNPQLTPEQQALVYGITGGIPHYINKLNVQNNIDEALLENLFNTSSYLYEEPENLLKQELREPAVYNSIITAIAGGASRPNEISTKVGIESAICAKYLKVLLELGILTKTTPITEKFGKKQSIVSKITSSAFGTALFHKTSLPSVQEGFLKFMSKLLRNISPLIWDWSLKKCVVTIYYATKHSTPYFFLKLVNGGVQMPKLKKKYRLILSVLLLKTMNTSLVPANSKTKRLVWTN